ARAGRDAAGQTSVRAPGLAQHRCHPPFGRGDRSEDPQHDRRPSWRTHHHRTDLTMQPVTLASTSAVRRAILSGAGVVFDAVSPGVDEDAVKEAMQGASAASLSLELA